MTQSEAQPAALEPAAEAAPAALAWSTRLAVVILLALVAVRTLNAAALFPRLTNDTSEFSTRAKALPHTGEVRFEATDGTRLYGWVTGLDTAPRKILFTCGNGGHVPGNGERMADVARALDAQVLVFDYRGYYLSEGSPSEGGLYKDARGAWLFATGQLGWKPSQIVVWGHSLGAAVAIALVHDLEADEARRREVFGAGYGRATKPAALIVESPFSSAADMSRRQFGYLGIAHWLLYASFDNVRRAGEMTVPAFVMHGQADEIIPFDMGEKVFAAFRNARGHLWIRNGNHNGLWGLHKVVITSALEQFLSELRN